MIKKRNSLVIVILIMGIAALALVCSKCCSDEVAIQDIDKYTRDGKLIYAADDSAPPLRFIDDDGVYKGVVVDYVNQLALELGIEIECRPYKWTKALDALDKGETDLCDMFINKERSEKYVFTDPIYTLRTILAISADADYGLSDINNLKVATQKGDYANSYLMNYYPEAELVYVHDAGAGLKLLVEGKVDAAIGDEPVMSYYSSEYGLNEKIKTINTSVYEEEVVLAVNKNKRELVDALNVAIAKVKAKGQLEKIQQKWFGISKPLIESSNSARIMKYLAFIMFAVAALIVFKQYETVTLRKQVGERTRELQTKTNELDLIFNEMPEGVIMVDASKRIINCNSAGLAIAGKEWGDMIGKPCHDSFRSICETCEECIIDKCYREKSVVVLKTARKTNLYELRGFYIDDEYSAGNPLIITINDITKAEIQNRQFLQSSKMMAVGQLAAGMAHQIRNPLGVIRTHSYIMRNRCNDENMLKSLNFIDQSVDRAGGIIDNVMKFWRISDLKLSDVNIKDFFVFISELEHSDAKLKKIDIEIKCPSELTFYTSEESLKHIILNLFQNAVDAAPEDGGKIVLTAEISEDGELVMTCKDSGAGISKKNMEYLFNPFFSTKAPGKGTGLGLYIVYTEVQNLDGRVFAESEEGEWAKFTIILPDIRNNGENNGKDL